MAQAGERVMWWIGVAVVFVGWFVGRVTKANRKYDELQGRQTRAERMYREKRM